MGRRRNQINLRLRQATRLIENVSRRVKYVRNTPARAWDRSHLSCHLNWNRNRERHRDVLLRQRLLSRTASYDRKLQSKFKCPEFNATRIIDNMGE